MRLNLNDSIKTELLPWAARAAHVVAVCAFVAAFASACKREGNAQIDNGTLGLALSPISGNNQGARPSFVYTQPLILQTLDNAAQVPMPYVQVDFTVLTAGSDAIVLIPTTVSDKDGMVQTKIRAPSAYGQTIQVEARIRGTTVASIFQLNTSNLGTATRFVADTTHNNIETAGVPFGFIIRVTDDSGTTVPNYSGALSLVWAFQSAASWGGSTPTLPATGLTCVFTAGVCTTATTYVLTDSRVKTKMWVGDGNDGLQDEFAKEITVNSNVRDHLLIADKIGGPAAGAVPFGATGIFFNADQGLLTAPGGGSMYFASAVVDVVGNFLHNPDAVSWSIANQNPVLTPTWAVQNNLALVGITGSMIPKVVGSGDLTVTYTGAMGAVSAGARKLYVDPGPDRTKWRLVAIPEHVNNLTACVEAGTCSATERAGRSFSVTLKAVDSQGNALSGSASNSYADDFSGNFRVQLSFTGGVTGGRGALFNSTCSNAIGVGNADLSNQMNLAAGAGTPIANSVCANSADREQMTFVVPFVKGAQNTTIFPIKGVLQWATDIVANNLTTAGVSNLRLRAELQGIGVTWNIANTYSVNDMVVAAGIGYTALQAVPAGIAITNTAYWVPDCGLGFPCLANGIGAGPLTVPTGSPAAINLWDGPGGPAAGRRPLCERTRLEVALLGNPALTGQGTTPIFNCPYLARSVSGDTPPDFYPVLEDRGGNYLQDLPSNFAGQLTTATEWTVLGGGTSGRFRPIVAAQDTVIVTGNSTVNVLEDNGTTSTNVTAATTFGEAIAPLPLDHFILQTTDTGTPALPMNTISVLNPYTLRVLAYDVNNNFLGTFNGNYVFTFNTVGSSASPLGTAAIPAPNGTYTFTAGVARIRVGASDILLRQPRNQAITIQMTGVPALGGATYSAQDLPVIVQPGPITSIQIRDAANGAGNNLTNQPVTMTDLDSMTFHAAAFDDELNPLTAGSTDWSSTGNLAALTTPAVLPATATGSVTYSPTLLGSGVLSATANGYTVSTGTVTVNPSAATHLGLSVPTIPVAGGLASVNVQILDARNNPIAYTGNLGLDIQVSNAATRKGFSFTSAYAPQGGGPVSYAFNDGAITLPHDYTLYNAGSPALIRYQVTSGPANITSLPSATLSVTATPDAAYQVWIARPGSTMAAGSTASYLAYMVDQYGNTVTGYPSSSVQVSLNAPSGDQLITKLNSVVTSAQVVNGTMGAGVVSFDVYGTATGTMAPRVTVSGGPANAARLDDMTVINGTPTQLVWTTNTAATYKAGEGLDVTATIRDAYNNVVTSGSDATAIVTLNLYQAGAPASGQQIGSWAMAAVAGVADFNGGTVLTRPYLTVPGVNFTVRASAATSPVLNVGDSNVFNVTSADDYQLVYTTQPAASTCTANGLTQAGQCAGVAFNMQPVVAIRDQYGNQSSATGTNVFLTPFTTSNCAAGTIGNTGQMMPGSNPSAATASGAATFSGVGYKVADSTSGGSVYLQASAGTLVSACSNAVLVKPAQANAPTYVAGTGLASGTVGATHSAANEMPQFKTVDAYGNGVPNYTMNFSWYYNSGNGYNYGQTVTASATTDSTGMARPSTFRLMNATDVPSNPRGCADGTNYIQADTNPNIGTAYSAAILTTPGAPASVVFMTQPQTGASNQGQTLNTSVQTQGVARLRDASNNCAYNVPNGSDTFTLSLYTGAGCATPAAGAVLANNTATISNGEATFSGWRATAIPSTGTSYRVGVSDSTNGFTACGTQNLRWYNPITPIYFNSVGTTTVTTPATTGSVMLIVKDGVPSSYTWEVTSAGSAATNCGNPSVSASFTGGACPATYTCSTYTPACLGNNSTDTVRVTDGSGSTTANNRVSANVTVSGARLTWQVSTPTSWGAFSSATTTTYTLRNSGNGDTGVDLASAFSADSHFSIQADNCSGVALTAGSTCTIVIRFDPLAAPALPSGANRTGSVYYYGAPGGQTSTINFNASRL